MYIYIVCKEREGDITYEYALVMSYVAIVCRLCSTVAQSLVGNVPACPPLDSRTSRFRTQVAQHKQAHGKQNTALNICKLSSIYPICILYRRRLQAKLPTHLPNERLQAKLPTHLKKMRDNKLQRSTKYLLRIRISVTLV